MTIRPPAHVEPYVAALGEARAIAFLVAFGGAPMYIAGRPQTSNRLVPVVGTDGVAALREAYGSRIERVPTAKVWIARVWHDQGITVSEIARRLHITDKTVRGYIRQDAAGSAAQQREAQAERRAELRARQGDLEDWLRG